MLLDTSKPTSTAPLYLTYLAGEESQISAIRVDAEGNAYVTGTTSSTEFPHQASFSVRGDRAPDKSARMSFVSVLAKSGSALRWSTLLRDADFAALALDPENNIYLAGRTGDGPDAVLARLSGAGSKLSFVTRLGRGDARAVSAAAGGVCALVEGESQSFALARDPCT